MIHQRDVLETGFLIDYLSSHVSKIKKWKESSRKDRLDNYKPIKIIKALDRRDCIEESRRYEIYIMMCENAAHPTFKGNKLLAPEGFVKIGPFINNKFLKSTIEELALRVPYFTVIYSSFFQKIDKIFLKMKIDYFTELKNWSQKFLKIDLSLEDIETMKKWMELL